MYLPALSFFSGVDERSIQGEMNEAFTACGGGRCQWHR